MRKKKTHVEFIEEMKIINSNIEFLDEYKSAKEKISCKCKIDGYEWFATPSNLLQGKGCPKCGGTLKKTHDEFVETIKSLNPSIFILGRYSNNKQHIKVKCDICNYTWFPSGNSLLQGKGCPKCSGNIPKDNDIFVEELKKIKPHIIPLEKYINATTNIKFKCIIHNCKWYDSPSHILNNRGCPECAKESYKDLRMKKHDDYVREVKEIHKNIDVIGEYCGANSKILFRCNECGYEWESYPFNILKGCGCPRCARIGNSKLQEKVNEYISKVYQYKLLHEYECNLKPRNPKTNYIMPFDNELVELKLIIEVHGQQHYEITGFTKLTAEHYGTTEDEELEYQKWKDKYKKDYALDNGYSYLEIPYWTENDESYKTLIDNKINEILKEAV